MRAILSLSRFDYSICRLDDLGLICCIVCASWHWSRSDQKVQDVVDKIFPEYKERDSVLETEFYERHNFKKKKIHVAKSDELHQQDGAAAAVTVNRGGQTASTGSGASSCIASAADLSSASAKAELERAAGGSAVKRPLKFAQMPLSNWSMAIVKPFTIEVYPEHKYVG